MKLKPDLEAFYTIWPGNRSGLFYSSRCLHTANVSNTRLNTSVLTTEITSIPFFLFVWFSQCNVKIRRTADVFHVTKKLVCGLLTTVQLSRSAKCRQHETQPLSLLGPTSYRCNSDVWSHFKAGDSAAHTHTPGGLAQGWTYRRCSGERS